MTDRQVRVTLVFDDKGSVKILRKAGEESDHAKGKLDKLDRSVKGIGKSFGGLKGAISSGLGFLGAGSLIFGLGDIASKTKEISEETEKFHTVTGIGTKSSLYYAQALKARGLSGETVNKAFGFLAKNLKSAELQESKFALSQTKAAARGVLTTSVLGKQAGAFKELGINISSFSRLNEQEKLEAVTKAFENLAPGIQKTRLEKELFGRGAEALSTVLEKNNLGLSHQLELVKKYFPTVKGGAHALDELTEKQAESKMAWEGLEFTLGQKLIPAMTAVMGWFSRVAVEVEKGRGFWGGLATDISGVADAIKMVVGWLHKLADAFHIPVGVQGLGGALLAFAGIHSIKHPISALKKVSTLGKIVKGAESVAKNPAADAAAGRGLSKFFGPIGTAIVGAETLAGTYHTATAPKISTSEAARSPAAQALNEIWHAISGGAPAGTYGTPHIRGGRLAGVEPGVQHQKVELHVDGKKLGEALLQNVGARRMIAEAAAVYAQQMAARR